MAETFKTLSEILTSLADNRTGAITGFTMRDWCHSVFQGHCMGYWTGQWTSQGGTGSDWALPATPLDFSVVDSSDGGASKAGGRCRYDIDEDGTYLIYTQGSTTTGSGSACSWSSGIGINGADPTNWSVLTSGTNKPLGCYTLDIRKLSAGDYIEYMVYVNSGVFPFEDASIIIVRLWD
jgi:hypothetical protein